MSVILYARVSTGSQAEKELSIPAQVRAMRSAYSDVVGVYQDVSSATGLQHRPGLMAAIKHATRDKTVRALVVHKVDRLARNTYQYLTIKGKLRVYGVSIVSVVEHFEDSPMGEFIEHIMAAQAEFYSANLSFEVKKGMVERLRRGNWNGSPPVGYLRKNDLVIPDPARSRFIRRGFELWSTGSYTAEAIAQTLYEQGLVSRHGNRISKTRWYKILQNQFYTGKMQTRSGTYPGLHTPLVSQALFDQCQAVFRRKRPKRGAAARKHRFLLSGLVRCPTCPRHLAGEVHQKNGHEYRYYRCQRGGCRYSVRASALDEFVLRDLLAHNIAKHALPRLLAEARQERRLIAERHSDRIRELRRRRRTLDDTLQDLGRQLTERKLRFDVFERQAAEIHHAIRATEWLIAGTKNGADEDAWRKVRMVRAFDAQLRSDDLAEQRQAVVELVEEVLVSGPVPEVILKTAWTSPGSKSPAAVFQAPLNEV